VLLASAGAGFFPPHFCPATGLIPFRKPDVTEYYETDDGLPPETPGKRSGDDGGLTWAAKAGAVVIAVFVGVILLADHRPEQTPYSAVDSQVAPPQSFAKSQSVNEVQGKSAALVAEIEDMNKGQIRAKFGNPDVVKNNGDMWFYFKLQENGVDVGPNGKVTTIGFLGFGNDFDKPVNVNFN
jgi:hypothetical protein